MSSTSVNIQNQGSSKEIPQLESQKQQPVIPEIVNSNNVLKPNEAVYRRHK